MFELCYLGAVLETFNSIQEAIERVRKDYQEWLDQNFYLNDEEFDWDNYEVFERIKVDFKNILTTNHRGSFPKSYRAEGVNFID